MDQKFKFTTNVQPRNWPSQLIDLVEKYGVRSEEIAQEDVQFSGVLFSNENLIEFVESILKLELHGR